ncbi:aminotransferase class IV [Alkalinema sp. FACHB-956]|uniref:aminotransferase class IV n=1 Tax=Alkalinema sp. FACHB-956 TaxID=2692768 RepID=UPI0016874A30|nr:aminotransferase class IV [Alkalinema sp. FACHB-956]MBD2327006.1 aminotransferase class IV [Alkalinema sp. FACHB-956]
MAITLQKPQYVYFDGKICLWEDAVFHISSEAVLRGLNVFEGLKGYWQPDGRFGIVAMRRHYDRLVRSAKILHMPFTMSFEEFEAATHELLQLLHQPDKNMWIRATLYGEEGHWGENCTSNLVLTAYQTPLTRQAPIATGVTAWQRAGDLALPCRVKTSTNYQVARLVKIEGRDRGYSEMILLNGAGRVAEGLGGCIIMVRDGAVITPPAWEGALESITVDIVQSLCQSMGIPFERRPVDRTELMIADEIGFVGTLHEITPVCSLDGQTLGEATIINSIAERYIQAACGINPHPAVDLALMTMPIDRNQSHNLSEAGKSLHAIGQNHGQPRSGQRKSA